MAFADVLRTAMASLVLRPARWELKDYRNYEVVVTGKLSNSRTYRFTLEFRMNAWAITLIVLGLTTVVGAAAALVMKRKRLFKK